MTHIIPRRTCLCVSGPKRCPVHYAEKPMLHEWASAGLPSIKSPMKHGIPMESDRRRALTIGSTPGQQQWATLSRVTEQRASSLWAAIKLYWRAPDGLSPRPAPFRASQRRFSHDLATVASWPRLHLNWLARVHTWQAASR